MTQQIGKQVLVPYSFFVKTARHDYNSPAKAIVRELLQNSRDAKSKQIDFEVTSGQSPSGEEITILSCQDDGCGMNQDTIENKLMALGESAKGEGDTGGFGVAKILLFFSHERYEICTKNMQVKGRGCSYEISHFPEIVRGTGVRIWLNSEVVGGMPCDAFKRMLFSEVEKSDLRGIVIRLNGETLETDSKRTRLIKTINDDIKIYRRKRLDSDRIGASFRVKGLHMFELYHSSKDYFFSVELSGYSTKYLTTNRDSLKSNCRGVIEDALRALSLNTSDSFEEKTNLYSGQNSRVSPAIERLVSIMNEQGSEISSDVDVREKSREIVAKLREEGVLAKEGVTDASGISALESDVENKLRQRQGSFGCQAAFNYQEFSSFAPLRHAYYVVTKGNYRVVPKAWRPENFKKKQRYLLELWSEILGLVLKDAGVSLTKYNVGFILDAENEDGASRILARYDEHKYYHQGRTITWDRIFLLNPEIYGDEGALPMQRDRRLELIFWLRDLACHEVTHLLGYSYHNESFISMEAEVKRKSNMAIKDYIALSKKEFDEAP